MKKTVAVLLTLIMVFGITISGAFAVSAEQLGDFTFTVKGGKATITGYTGESEDVTIPDTIGGYPVTKIGDYAFNFYKFIESVTIPDSVVYIGDYAFGNCMALTSITIPEGVETIGAHAFDSCKILTQVDIPGSVTSIGEYAFEDCPELLHINVASGSKNYTSQNDVLFSKDKTVLVRVPAKATGTYTIPAGVKQISAGAFEGCVGITAVTIPDSVTFIGDRAFSGSGLKNITIPSKVNAIGLKAFELCKDMLEITVADSNDAYSSVGGALYNKDITTLIQYPCGKEGSYTIPESVTVIADYAFKDNTKLTFVNMSDNVTSIGKWAFTYCENLGAIYISKGLKSVGSYAFMGCLNLVSVALFEDTTVGNYAFYGCLKLTLYAPENSPAHIYTKDLASIESIYATPFAPSLNFTDVNSSQWFYKAAAFCFNNNMMSGVSSTTFAPDMVMSRAMFVTVLAKMLGANVTKYTESSFTDVPTGMWYSQYVEWANDKKFVSGIGDGKFGPEENITREQIAQIFSKVAEWKGYPPVERADLSSYTDENSISSWAYDAVSWAVNKGLLTGTSATTLSPGASITRAQCAQIVLNFVPLFE